MINCPVYQQTNDKIPIGRCYRYLKDGKTCPIHGDVTKAIMYYKKTNTLLLEEDLNN